MGISDTSYPRNRTLVFAGTVTMMQCIIQCIFSGLAIAQYFCLVDFLKGYETLIYIKILYIHNPEVCGNRIPIGVIEGVPNSAFVLLQREPLTTTRTYIINCCALGLSVIWFISSALLMTTASKSASPLRWPWIVTTVIVTSLDVVATIIFINDSFYTKTLTDIMSYIGGTVSGLANVELNTTWAAWLMVIIYCRFVVFLFVNLVLVIVVIIKRNKERRVAEPIAQAEPTPPVPQAELPTIEDEDETSEQSTTRNKIPRVSLNKSFSRMKNYLFSKPNPPLTHVHRALSSPTLPVSVRRPPSPLRTDFDKKRSVNFPENLLSLPQRLENMIAEQQKRLDQAVIDTSGRLTPTRVSQSLPHLATNQDSIQSSDELLNSISKRGRRRRSTVAELQGQLPWTYVESSTYRMRDNLPPDEDLPPVPLADYTAVQNRKASVHRASSSVSVLGQQRREEFAKKHPRRSPANDIRRFVLGSSSNSADS